MIETNAILRKLYSAPPGEILTLIESDSNYLSVYRSLDWVELARGIDNARSKSDQLDIFRDFFRYLPPQGSAAWRKQRQGAAVRPPTIGGSEIHKIVRGTPSEKKELYKEKLGLSAFRGNMYTQWGNLFEPMIQLFCDKLYQSTTYETGSIPGLRDSDGNVIQSYSPDGVGIMTAKNYLEITNAFNGRKTKSQDIEELLQACTPPGVANERGEIINLLEFKCPPTRLPDGKVPKQYYSQPRTGACTIDIVDTCLFVDAAFRRCSYEQFISSAAGRENDYNNDPILNRYDTKTSFTPKSFPFSKKYPMGVIGLYDTSEPYSDDATTILDLINSDYASDHAFEDELADILVRDDGDNGDDFEFDDCDPMELLEQLKGTTDATADEDLIDPPSIRDILSKTSEQQATAFADFARDLDVPESSRKKQNIVKLVRKIWRHMEDANAYITGDTMADMWGVLRELVPDFRGINANQKRIYDSIVSDTIDGCLSEDALQNYMRAGIDFGKPRNNQRFLSILRRAIDERFYPKGCKIYYPENILHVRSEDPEDPEDPEETTEDYLNRQIHLFLRECKIRNAKPVGIIPWKLMKVSLVPIKKEPDFLANVEDEVRKVASEIHKVRMETADLPPAEMMERRAQMVNELCPVRSRPKSAKKGMTQEDLEWDDEETSAPPDDESMNDLISSL